MKTALMRLRLVGASCLLLSACAAMAPATDAMRPAPHGFATAAARGLDIAVGVYGLRTADAHADDTPPRDDEVADRVAAGFIVSGNPALIVTAAHAVSDGVERILVKLPDQRIASATLVGDDEAADIALLKIDVPLAQPPAPGRSSSLRPGDWVLAVGEPYGLNRSVVAGIVGGKDRHFAEDFDLLFIQTDVALNPGNSGGPLLDVNGKVVGMNTRTVVSTLGSNGLSLSIPIEIVMQVVEELRASGQVSRPRLGARFDDVSPRAAMQAHRPTAKGALVLSVDAASIGARLGLAAGDIIVGMNGRAVESSGDLVRALLAWRSERGTQLTVYREGRYQELTLALPTDVSATRSR